MFLKKYIATFKFQSIDTDMFINFLKANIPGIEKEIDLEMWTEGNGIPPDAYEPVSSIYTNIVSLASLFKLGRMPREDEVADWEGQQWELYLENLPKSGEASQVRFCFIYAFFFLVTRCYFCIFRVPYEIDLNTPFSMCFNILSVCLSKKNKKLEILSESLTPTFY